MAGNFAMRELCYTFVFEIVTKTIIKMKRLILSGLMVLVTVVAMAQQNIGFKQGPVKSPVVNSDNTVTFRLSAPKAKTVTVIGDWEADNGRGKMKKGKDGVWEFTTPVLPSEMYTYRFDVDGVVGLDPTNPFCRRDVGTIFSMFYVGNGVADYYQVRDVPHGALTQTWYHSDAVGKDRRLSIYTPPFYEENNKRYPVLYLLHGSGGDENAWLELGHTVRILDNLIAEGKVEPMIVVMPNGNIAKQAAPGETSENMSYIPCGSGEIPGNYKNGIYEMNFTEIISYTESHYRCIPGKDGRAIAGLSMGGFHTLYTFANHSDKFNYVGIFSGGLNMKNIDQTLPAYSNLDEKLKAAEYKLFWIAIGRDDFLYEANQDLLKRMDRLGKKYEYVETSRGHLWSNWRQYLVQFTQKIFRPSSREVESEK